MVNISHCLQLIKSCTFSNIKIFSPKYNTKVPAVSISRYNNIVLKYVLIIPDMPCKFYPANGQVFMKYNNGENVYFRHISCKGDNSFSDWWLDIWMLKIAVAKNS